MKKILTLIGLFSFYSGVSQIIKIKPDDYNKLKSSGQLNPNANYFPQVDAYDPYAKPIHYTGSAMKVDSANTSSCNCYVPLDSSFTIANFTDGSSPSYRGDDGSTPQKLLPFSFCFYGTSFNSVYINRNGNITFGTGSPTYSSTGFPNNSDKMIAPFWADVDTRNTSSGLVYYKIQPHSMIIKWKNVGYYDQHVDKLCDFQLIISDGTDPIIPDSNNIAFCYGNMDWTTGDASSGTNGFGGIASTVGVNKGDGVNYFQIGRFDHAGNIFVGNANSTPNGVDWLDNKQFYLNSCGSSTNIPPLIVSGTVPGCLPDTFHLCSTGDTLLLNYAFTGPEPNQTITVTSSAPTLGSNFNIVTSTANGVTNASIMIVGTTSAVGTHLVTITATDNGSPSLNTTINYIIDIPNANLPPPVLTVNPVPSCTGTTTVTLQSCSQYPNILWSDNSTGCSMNLTHTDTVSVTLTSASGCKLSTFRPVLVHTSPIPTITGLTNFCNNNGTTLSVTTSGSTAPITNYSWTVAGSTNNDSAFVQTAGPVSITVTDSIGCSGTASVNITNVTPPVTISSNFTNFCPGQPVTLTASLPGGSYVWSGPGSPFPNSQSIVVTPLAASTYSVTVTVNGCIATNSKTLNPLFVPVLTDTVPTYCVGRSTTATVIGTPAGNYNYTWQPGGTTGATLTTNTAGTYTVTATVNGGCSGQTVVTIPGPHVNPVPSITTQSGPNIICYKGTQTLNSHVNSGTPGFNYSWTPSVPLTSDSSSTYVVPNPGTYSLTVTDTNNCTGTTNITLTLITPTVVVTTPSLICKGDTALLVAQGQSTTPITYSWQPSLSSNDSIYVTQEDNYSITVTDQNGCTASDITAISYYPNPDGAFVVNPASPSTWGDEVTITDQSTISFGYITNYVWNFGDGAGHSDTIAAVPLTHDYVEPGTYTISLITTSDYGCKDTIVMEHKVIVIIPHVNIITPNGDSHNNYLEFKGIQFMPNNKLTIFDRWGKKIFEQTNYDNKWNGDGHSDGTYYYILEIPTDRPQTFSNYFQIAR